MEMELKVEMEVEMEMEVELMFFQARAYHTFLADFQEVGNFIDTSFGTLRMLPCCP